MAGVVGWSGLVVAVGVVGGKFTFCVAFYDIAEVAGFGDEFFVNCLF